MGIMRLAGLSILIVITSLLALGFVVSYSVTQQINEEVVTEVAKDTLRDVVEGDIVPAIESEIPQIDTAQIIEILKERCAFEESVYVDDLGIELNCSVLNELDDSGLEGLIETYKAELVNESIEALEPIVIDAVEERVFPYLKYLNWAVIGIGIALGVLVLLIFAVSGSVPAFLISTGIALVVSWLLSLPLIDPDIYLAQIFIERFGEIINGATQMAHSLMLFVLYLGLFVISGGVFFWHIGRKEKEKKKNDT